MLNLLYANDNTKTMNGWAKVAGIIPIVAGIVFIIAMALAVSNGASSVDGALSVFLANNNFKTLAMITAMILFVAAIVAVCAGMSNKKGSISITGASFAVLGMVMLVSVLDNVTGITTRAVEYDYIGSFLFIAAAAFFMGLEKKRYIFSVIAIFSVFSFKEGELPTVGKVNGHYIPFRSGVVLNDDIAYKRIQVS